MCACVHGWEIAVILRNFRKTKLSKSKFLFFFFLFIIFFYSISTCMQCATRRLSLCDIHKYRFPAFYGTSDRQAAIFFRTRMIQTWSSSRLVDPCSIFFCFSVKPKFFTPTHVCVCVQKLFGYTMAHFQIQITGMWTKENGAWERLQSSKAKSSGGKGRWHIPHCRGSVIAAYFVWNGTKSPRCGHVKDSHGNLP